MTLSTHLEEVVKDLQATKDSFADREDDEAFKALLRNLAHQGNIILVCVDSGYTAMAINLYLTSFKRLNITNYIFMGTDAYVCPVLRQYNITCHTYIKGLWREQNSIWGTSEFSKKTHYKTRAILDVLLLGYTVLIVDVDIVFLKNPFPYLNCQQCDIQIQNDMVEGNSGFYLARPSKPSISLHSTAWKLSQQPQSQSNQKLLDRTMEKMERKNEIRVRLLPDNLFPNGVVYFEQGHRMFVGDAPCSMCVIVHNNWILGGAAKELRFKETGLWEVDTQGYYSDPKQKYIIYSNPEDFGVEDTLPKEKQALQAALSIGYLLKRVVILPKFHCHHCDSKACQTPHQKCAFGTFFKVGTFDKQFAGLYRESVFLKHKLVPGAIKNSISPEIIIAPRYKAYNKGNSNVFHPADDRGATATEIVSWLEPFSKYSILKFHSLYKAFLGFDSDESRFDVIKAKLAAAFSSADYRNF